MKCGEYIKKIKIVVENRKKAGTVLSGRVHVSLDASPVSGIMGLTAGEKQWYTLVSVCIVYRKKYYYLGYLVANSQSLRYAMVGCKHHITLWRNVGS